MSEESLAASAGHHQQISPDTARFGLLWYLVSEGLIFANALIAYFYLKTRLGTWPPNGHHIEITVGAINTVLLVASSFTYIWAEKAVDEENHQAFRQRLWITFGLGFLFILGQAYEWTHLEFGFSGSVLGGVFYGITGFHGLHVLAGLLMILINILRSRLGHFTSKTKWPVHAIGYYWHLVDIVWLFVFGSLYLLQ